VKTIHVTARGKSAMPVSNELKVWLAAHPAPNYILPPVIQAKRERLPPVCPLPERNCEGINQMLDYGRH
jgi:hypothetical protein